MREVLDAIKRTTGSAVPHIYGARRDGDPARLVSDARLIGRALGWKARFSDIDTIIRTAWSWHRRTSAQTTQ